MRVDAHQHFWQYSNEEFGWISDPMASIRRDFAPADLHPLIQNVAIDATIAVQARQSLEETNWLLQLAAENNWIAGVVGWVSLVDPNVEPILEILAANPKLKGVRHVLQAEPVTYMAREDFNVGISLLHRFSLVYDILVVENQLPASIDLVDRHPNQVFVLDHLAKPMIASHQLEPWRTNILELAKRPNVSCKISGMVTEADLIHWTKADLVPYVDTVLEAFGPSRILFGSDWPVCTVAASYGDWFALVQGFLGNLSSNERAQVLGGNAIQIYGL